MCGKSPGLLFELSGLKSQLSQFLAMWSWAKSLIFLNLSFITGKRES